MHSMNIKIKIISAQQARIHIIYKNIKLKLLKKKKRCNMVQQNVQNQTLNA